MNKRYLLLLLVLFPFLCKSSSWFPVGAKWHYTYYEVLSPVVNYGTMEIVGDTVINGVQCQKMDKRAGCDYIDQNAFVYEDSGKVFFYDENISDFKLLYDLNLVTGDKLIVFPQSNNNDDSLILVIDSIGTEIINNVSLKVQYVSPVILNPSWLFAGKIIEKVGLDSFFFPQISVCSPYYAPLRCYSDTILGLYETGTVDSCDQVIILNIASLGRSEIAIFPNPAQDFLSLQSNYFRFANNVKIDLIDMFGLEQYNSITHPSSDSIVLPLQELRSGYYFLRCNIDNKYFITYHFIKL